MNWLPHSGACSCLSSCTPYALVVVQSVSEPMCVALQVVFLSKAGSHGINLVSCCRMAMLDEDWNPVWTAQVGEAWAWAAARGWLPA